MDERIKSMLNEEIISEIEDLKSLQQGGDEHTKAVDNLVKLYKLRIEEAKIDLEAEEKEERRIMDAEKFDAETDSKEKELIDEAKNRYIRLGMEAAGIVLPLVFYAYWMHRGFKFEETGTFTSTTFRGLFNRFRPSNK